MTELNNLLKNENILGSHILKKKTFLSSVSDYHKETNKTSMQLFTGSTKSWKRKDAGLLDLELTKQYVNENKINLYIHSIYLINLGRPASEIQPAIDCLKWEFKHGPLMGAKGVVVHVGKHLKMQEPIAKTNMYNNMISLLPFIDESCPFLLETPAGQGTEMLKKMNEFLSFYNSFTEEERRKIKICIDTCHVWSSSKNHFPDKYIETFDRIFPGSVILIHFNDSKTEHGSKKDRHAYPGNGTISSDILKKVADICIKKNIPMIIE